MPCKPRAPTARPSAPLRVAASMSSHQDPDFIRVYERVLAGMLRRGPRLVIPAQAVAQNSNPRPVKPGHRRDKYERIARSRDVGGRPAGGFWS